MKHYTESEKQTAELGEKYAKTLEKGDIVLLLGDMGAGKTAASAIDEYLSGK